MTAKQLTFQTFHALPKYQKFDKVFSYGSFINSRTAGKNQVILYDLGKFYVELHFDSRVNRIVKLNSFLRGGTELKKYDFQGICKN